MDRFIRVCGNHPKVVFFDEVCAANSDVCAMQSNALWKFKGLVITCDEISAKLVDTCKVQKNVIKLEDLSELEKVVNGYKEKNHN